MRSVPAVFAGLTAVLSKIGVRDTDSDLATAVRTAVVLVFSWIMVFLTGSAGSIGTISAKTCLFLVLSGVATGGFLAVLFQGPSAWGCEQGCPPLINPAPY